MVRNHNHDSNSAQNSDDILQLNPLIERLCVYYPLSFIILAVFIYKAIDVTRWLNLLQKFQVDTARLLSRTPAPQVPFSDRILTISQRILDKLRRFVNSKGLSAVPRAQAGSTTG